MSAVNNLSASKEIHRLAHEHGLVDVYADSPGSRFGEYVDRNGRVVCRVYDVDPAADLVVLRAAAESALTKAQGQPSVSGGEESQ